MEYFAGLDVSMAETHVCIMNRDGTVVHEVKVPSIPANIATAFTRLRPVSGSCSRLDGWRRCSITA